MFATALLAACTPSIDDDDGWQVPPPNDLPVLEVDQPARGAFSSGPVTVRGRVGQGSGDLSSLVIADEDVAVKGAGVFETTIAADAPGILLLGSRLEDAAGERAVDGRAVYVGETRPPGAVIPDAVSVHMGYDLLDDDEPDLDDIAGVVEAVLADPAFAQGFAGTAFSNDSFSILLQSMSVGAAEVDIRPLDGLLELDAVLTDVDASFRADVYGAVGTNGSASMDELVLRFDLGVGTGERGVVVEALWSDARVEGFEWQASNVPGWLENLLSDTLRTLIETRLEQGAMELVGGLVSDTLESMALSTSMAEGRVWVDLALTRAEATFSGLSLGMDGSVTAIATPFALPEGAGSLTTPGDAPPLPLSGAAPLQAVIDDDFLNQLLFALWYGGAFSDWTFTGEDLEALSGAPLPPPLGPVSRATIGAHLPPVLSPPTGELPFDVSMGELWFDIEREDGEQVGASINLRAGAEMTRTEAGLGMQVDNRPAAMDVHVGMRAWPQVLDPGDLASLFRLSTPALLGQASSLFPSFPSPEVPLDAIVPAESLEDRVWALHDTEVVMAPDGFLLLRARLSDE